MSELPDKLRFLSASLAERRETGRLRELRPAEPHSEPSRVVVDGKELINFCSNDYLGLSRHPKVVERSVEYTRKYGSGAGSSRLVSGNLSIYEELEEKLAATFGFESVLLFNTGFQANTSLLASLADRNSLILADKRSHNSLLQGALLSRADFRRFAHNDYGQLEEVLKQACSENYNRVWVVSETVFSMDGDRSDLDQLTELTARYDALLYSDDAHALGVLGDKGLGLNYGREGIHISLGTFGKAFGSFGAFAGCPAEMKKFLVNFSAGFIYTTALPPAVIGALDAALELIPHMDEERKELLRKVRIVKDALKEMGYELGHSDSQIIPVITGSESSTIECSKFMEDNGLWLTAIRPPTVEKGASRLRITLTAAHTGSDIDQLTEAFRKWKNR